MKVFIAAINSVKFLSKLELSSRFFGHLNFFCCLNIPAVILQCRRATQSRLLDILISFEHDGYGYYLRPQSSDKATVLVLPCEGGSQIKEMVVFFADTFKMGLFGLKWMSTLCKLCMKVTYLGRWGRLVLGERGLERCQGSAGRLNCSPGDDDDDDEEEEDFVGGDEMFFFSI